MSGIGGNELMAASRVRSRAAASRFQVQVPPFAPTRQKKAECGTSAMREPGGDVFAFARHRAEGERRAAGKRRDRAEPSDCMRAYFSVRSECFRRWRMRA